VRIDLAAGRNPARAQCFRYQRGISAGVVVQRFTDTLVAYRLRAMLRDEIVNSLSDERRTLQMVSAQRLEFGRALSPFTPMAEAPLILASCKSPQAEKHHVDDESYGDSLR
jgi:hypothetical protein